MRYRIPFPAALAATLLGVLALTLPGCSPSDQLAEARAGHAVELLGFSVEKAAVAPQGSRAGEASADSAGNGGASAETSEGSGTEVEARLLVADAERSTVRLRVKVRRTDAKFLLPGITVEAVLQDGETGDEKEAYRVWLPLGGPWPDGERVVDAELAGVPYREGDTFDVTLRPQVPKVERSLYREFAGR